MPAILKGALFQRMQTGLTVVTVADPRCYRCQSCERFGRDLSFG